MLAIGFKIFFRKQGTTSAILAVTLLVAVLASMNSIVNHINLQMEALGERINLSDTFLILSRNSTSLTDSAIDAKLAGRLEEITDLKYVLPQKVLAATLTKGAVEHKIQVRAVDDVIGFLKNRRIHLTGASARNEAEANIGEMLVRTASINLEDEVNITIGGNILNVKIIGLVKTYTNIDSELIVPMEALNCLTEEDDKISLIEFALKDHAHRGNVLTQVTELLPENVKIVEVQQVNNFLHDVNNQTLTFLNQWSLVVSAVVVVASYVVATRFVTENAYELVMLKTLGAKNRFIFMLVSFYTLLVALLGFILGSATGLAGTQILSTAAKWILTADLTPFLEIEQLFTILLLTITSSILGCILPAHNATRKSYMEDFL